jgi:hypothetical protein
MLTPFDHGLRVVRFTPPGSESRSSSARTSPGPRPLRPRDHQIKRRKQCACLMPAGVIEAEC